MASPTITSNVLSEQWVGRRPAHCESKEGWLIASRRTRHGFAVGVVPQDVFGPRHYPALGLRTRVPASADLIAQGLDGLKKWRVRNLPTCRPRIAP